MSTLLRKIRTRSQSAASVQATTLNNQRPPKKGEWVRVRLKPSDTLGNNKTHGWVSIKVSDVYRIELEDESLKNYIVKGHTENNRRLNIKYNKFLNQQRINGVQPTSLVSNKPGSDSVIKNSIPEPPQIHNKKKA